MNAARTIVLATIICLAGCQGTVNSDNDRNSTPDAGLDLSLPPAPDFGMNFPSDPPDMTRVETDQGANDFGDETPVDMDTPDPIMEPPVDPGACGETTFDTALEVTPVAIGSLSRPFAAPTPAGGAFVAYSSTPDIAIAHLDGNANVLAEYTTTGSQIYGLAANADHVAVLVSRGSDVLALVILDRAGSVVHDGIVIGDVDHNVTDNEWFGPLIRTGRLTWTGDKWAAYYAVQRLWPDGVAHYGDQLRLYDEDGSAYTTQWGWGCSHSMDVRISHNGQRLGAICASDCYPAKGVHYNHRGGMLYPDEERSDCRGGWGAHMGASIPMDDGFWAIYTATDNREALDVAATRITGGSFDDPIWLTTSAEAAQSPNGARLGEDILVGWQLGGEDILTVLDSSSGSSLHGPQPYAAANLGSASDFFTFPNGDTGWVQAGSAGLELARFRNCP